MRSLYKIIHTSSRICWEETEKRILQESLWMEGRGHRVIIIAPEQSPLLSKAKKEGLTTYALSFKSLARIGEYGRIRQIFANETPFVVNCHGRADGRIALKAAQKTNVACRIMSRHTGGRLKNNWANRTLYKKLSHYVFTTAKDTTRHLQGLFGLSDMEIFSIPDGIIPPDTLISKNEARKKMAHFLGLGTETRFIGYAGKYPGQDKVKTILTGFEQISSEFDHHLVFSGEMTEEDRRGIAKTAGEAGIREKIHFYSKEAPWTAHRSVDTALQISGNPDFPGVPKEMIEAMYCNCPIVGSGTPGIRDLLVHEETGLVFDPKSHDALARVIRRTLEQGQTVRKGADAARQKAEKHHTIDAMGRDIIRIYRLHQVKLERRFLPGASYEKTL